MAGFNPSTFYTTSYYPTTARFGALSPPISTSLPYNLTTNGLGSTSLLSDSLLDTSYNPRAALHLNKNRLNGTSYDPLLGGTDTLSDTLFFDDTDLLLRNRLNFIGKNNLSPRNEDGQLNRRQKPNNQNGYQKPKRNRNNENEQVHLTEEEKFTNRIDRRLSKIPIDKTSRSKGYNSRNSSLGTNRSRPINYNRSRESNNFSNNNEFNDSQFSNGNNNNRYNNDQDFSLQNQKFNNNIRKPNNPQQQPKQLARGNNGNFDDNDYQNDSKNNNNYDDDNLEREKYEDDFNDENINTNINTNNNIKNHNEQEMFIYREIPKNNPNFINNSNNDSVTNLLLNGDLPRKAHKNGDSAEIDIATVSSMLSSENQSPDTQKIEQHRKTPYYKGGKVMKSSQNSSKNIDSGFSNGDRDGGGESRETMGRSSTPQSHLRELNLNLDLLNNDNGSSRKYSINERDSNFSKLQYFRENSNETVYRRETLTRIKPIVTKGDVAFGKDSIIPENDIKKAEKDEKRKIYGEFVKKRNNQMILADGGTNRPRYTVNEMEKRRKSTKEEARKVYARIVKEMNDDEYERRKQNEVLKSILPQIEKRGENIVKQKQKKTEANKKKSEYSEYVKERNQVLIDDQRKQRNLKIQMNQRYNEIQRNNDSYDTNTNDVAVNESVANGSVSNGSKSGKKTAKSKNNDNNSGSYSKSYRRDSYFVDLKDDPNDYNFYGSNNSYSNGYKQIFRNNRNNLNYSFDEFNL